VLLHYFAKFEGFLTTLCIHAYSSKSNLHVSPPKIWN